MSLQHSIRMLKTNSNLDEELMTNMILSANSRWVYDLEDYKSMFALTEHDLSCKILDYPGKISCFNAEMHALGHDNVVSADAYYDLAPMDMVKHVDYVIQELAEKWNQLLESCFENEERETASLQNKWNQYAQKFLADYSDGVKAGRYLFARLPQFPFESHQFDLALCSDLLNMKNGDLLTDVVFELTRVAREVRVFPLLNAQGKVADELGPTLLALQESNVGLEVRQVPYKIHAKENAMLRLWVKECVVE